MPLYLSWKLGGGTKTTIFLALLTTLPLLGGFWITASSISPRKNEKARFPGRPVEHYLTFKKPEDKAKYNGRNKIPMETFHEKYFDGEVDFNGDALEVMEYRHDWANFRFTISLIKFFLTGMLPEVIMHTRSQGTPPPSPTIWRDADLTEQTRSRFATTTTVATTSTPGSSARA